MIHELMAYAERHGLGAPGIVARTVKYAIVMSADGRYGLYACKGFISANLAEKTGFTDEDLALLWDALKNMFEHDRSASKVVMTTRKLYAFKHVGTDSDQDQRQRQAKLGGAPAQTLFGIVSVARKDPAKPLRCYTDYDVSVNGAMRAGVELLEL